MSAQSLAVGATAGTTANPASNAGAALLGTSGSGPARTKRVLWSPSGHNLFLVGSNDLRLYEWRGAASDPGSSRRKATRDGGVVVEPDEEALKLVALNADVPLLKCFAWAAHDTFDDLVAVGQTNGRAMLLRLREQRSLVVQQQQQSSASPSMSASPSPADLSPHLGEFVPRHARACNVVAFSPGQPLHLATGLDKVRNDYCLLLWDCERQAAAASSGGVRSAASTPSSQRPLQQYGSSEAITSLAWFPRHRGVLGAGMGFKWLRLYDTRQESSSSPSVVVASKAVYGINVDPFHEYRFASFTEEGVIKVFDMRAPSEALITLNQDGRSGLSRIAFNPNRRGYLASLSKEEDTLRLWNLEEGPAMVGTGAAELLQPTFLSAMSTMAVEAPPLLKDTASSILPFGRDTAGSRRTTEGESLSGGGSTYGVGAAVEIPLLWRTRQTKPAAFPIASFVWIPTASNTILALTKYNTIETVSVNEAKPISWQPHGALAVVDDQRMINTMSSQHVADNVANEKNAVTNENDTDISEIMRQRTERGYGMLMDKNLVLIADIPGLHAAWQWISRMQDVFTQGKSRIGNHDYTFEGVLSMVSATADARAAIVSGRKASVTALPPRVNGAEGSTAAMAYTAALNNKTTFIPISSSALGLSYAGVTAVTGGSESGKRGHLSPESTNAHGLPFLNMRRKLALQVCGWFYDADDLQASLDGMLDNGEYEKAAAWALFHDDVGNCIKSLAASGNPQNKIIATALAGYPGRSYTSAPTAASSVASSPGSASPGNVSALQMALWKDLSDSIMNPFLRAAFLFASSGGNFHSVLGVLELALCDRVGIALRFLPDNELTAYLDGLTNALVARGDLEALFLTGFTLPHSVALLQNYLNRTGDIQTVALLVAYCPLTCLKDVGGAGDADMGLRVAARHNQWIEIYRDLLDRWKFFHARCRFDIERRKVAQRNGNGAVPTPSSPFSRTPTSPTPAIPLTPVAAAIEREFNTGLAIPPQVYIRCNFCGHAVAHNRLLIPGLGMVGKSPGGVGASAMTSRYMSAAGAGSPGDIGSGYSSPSGGMGGGGGGGSGMAPNHQRTKHIACPSCRKPLPRCSICLLHMGMPIDGIPTTEAAALADVQRSSSSQSVLVSSASRPDLASTSSNTKPNSMYLWFTWCQKCRHGGHALHIMQWFARNDMCPVSDCACHCNIGATA